MRKTRMGRQHACLARESPQNPTDGQDPQKSATPRGTLLATSDILIAAHGKF
jgi:hypothetical protein